MFKGANYALSSSLITGTDTRVPYHSAYGWLLQWDKAKVLKVSQKRETVTVYFYNTKPRKNSNDRHICNLSFDEFYESFDMIYNLESIDGVHNA